MNEPQWTLLTVDGFSGAIGGSGKVFGTAGFQDILLLGDPGTIDLDASFNKGGDIVRLSGDAGDWQVSRSGSTALFSDGDTFVRIPAGVTGMMVYFDDGPRLLQVNVAQESMTIGSQAITGTASQIAAAPSFLLQFEPPVSDAPATLLMTPDGVVAAGGNLNVHGTAAGRETVHLLYGEARLDASFNQGGDTLRLDLGAHSFLARQIGSGLFLNSETTDVHIPAGVDGMTIEFLGGDERSLFIDIAVPAIFVGTQQIDASPVALTFA